MKQEYITYAKILAHIGDEIIKVSESLVGLNSGNVLLDRTVNEEKLKYGLSLYSECRAMLLNVAVPEILEDLHDKLINTFDEWLKGTSKMVSGLYNGEDLINKGYVIQSKAEGKFQIVCNEIFERIAKAS